ncbi:MAG: hypothetical protein JNK90_26500, partial [Planctomycetaceae bacterium]|nr:hypothetical protein [Planctomycetaceae bacterium]
MRQEKVWLSLPLQRRSCLQLGIAGLMGGSFFDLFRLTKVAAASDSGNDAGKPAKRPTSCILIWMDGG